VPIDPTDAGAQERLRVFLERALPLVTGRPIASPAQLQCVPIAGDGSVRRLFRVHQAGTSTVAVLNPLPDGRAHPDENEAFLAVRQFLALRGVRVPAVYAADPAQGLLLLEDLGDARLFEACRSGLDLTLYEQALEILALMQAPGEPAFRPEVTSNPTYDEGFILDQEAGYFLEEVVRRWCGLPWPREPVEADCRRLARQALGGPRVFMHRDFQSRNLMLLGWTAGAQADPASPADAAGPAGPADPPGLADPSAPASMARRPHLAVIDFQGARLGPPEYDVAALLFDPYMEMAPDAREALVLRYQALARAAGLLDASPSEPHAAGSTWRTRFLANAANRLMQALGAFVKLGVRQGRPGFREHIPRGLARLQAVLDEKGDVPALASLVRDVAARAAADAGPARDDGQTGDPRQARDAGQRRAQ